jgi:hypothetical protein
VRPSAGCWKPTASDDRPWLPCVRLSDDPPFGLASITRCVKDDMLLRLLQRFVLGNESFAQWYLPLILLFTRL